MIQRKPVPGRQPVNVDQKLPLDKEIGARATKDVEPSLGKDVGDTVSPQDSLSPQDSKPPPYNLKGPDATDDEGQFMPELDEQLDNLQLDSETAAPDALPEGPDESATGVPATKNASKMKAFMGTALTEAVHFAGGLVSHPYEATKHYSVLRHSIGLVYYRGPETSVAITVFSDQPLPPDRRLWLQKKGFSGKTGLAVGTLGTRSAWIDVTPARTATPDALPKADERAWQRDITKFLKKAKDTKPIRSHRPYETDIVRIPYVAADGYFRIVLCDGRKVLCPSPVFRYASTSKDPGMVRGASLSSLPLEIGVKIGSMVASNHAQAAMQPITTAVQNVTQPYNPLGLTQAAATTAYDDSGAQKKVNEVNEAYRHQQELSHQQAIGGDAANIQLVGGDEGPEHPYPIEFAGRVVQGTGRSRQELGMPTANLSNVSESTALRLSGVYIAWALIQPVKKLSENVASNDIYNVWHPAIVTVAPVTEKQVSVVERRSISTYLINDFGGADFFDSRLSVMVMGFIRPIKQHTLVEMVMQVAQDVSVAQMSLERPAWQADNLLKRIKTESSARSFTEKAASLREAGQKHIDKVPVHRLGVRMESMGFHDQLIGAGGICVKR